MITFEEFKIFKFQVVDSTNDVAYELIKKTKLPMVVVVADEQRKGRGRAGHSWHSQAGGLYFSIAMKSRGITEDSHLIVYSSLPVAETLLGYGLNPRIKLPNDVYIVRKKISGILGERKQDFLIIGIGINVNQKNFPEDISHLATSMFIETGMTYDRDEILYDFLDNFKNLLIDRESRYQRWLNFVSVIGKKVSFTYRKRKVEGVVENIDSSLNLQVNGEKYNIYEIFDFREP